MAFTMTLARNSEEALNVFKNIVATFFLACEVPMGIGIYLPVCLFCWVCRVFCLWQISPKAACMHFASLRPTRKHLGAWQATSNCVKEASWGNGIVAGRVVATTFVFRASTLARTIISTNKTVLVCLFSLVGRAPAQ